MDEGRAGTGRVNGAQWGQEELGVERGVMDEATWPWSCIVFALERRKVGGCPFVLMVPPEGCWTVLHYAWAACTSGQHTGSCVYITETTSSAGSPSLPVFLSCSESCVAAIISQ